ncbi:tetratricopeptide repeat protein [Fodinibius halophilus]|uniref:Uncharacterized protein n=1 Tax=Fodinibius halophilus TaxID=1736908 RepID=A0A6M1T259_9BACT|nr:hypothetical protein [Fodinibius halophilus]NGP89556.1 hypothetical protein [Fodinibius halophilus]
MRRFIFLITLLVSVTVSTSGQVPELINDPEFHPDAKAAVDSIYNFNFDGADSRLAPWKKVYPEHPIWTLLEGMKYWWKVLSDLQDTAHDERFINIMKRVDYQAGKLLYKHPSHADGLIIRAISNGYLARHNANRSNWVTSMRYGRKAMKAHQYLKQKQPDLADLKLAEGLKLYYTAYLPEAYPIVKTVSWALPSGDKTRGLQLIREASDEAIFARAEATYFLGNINYNYEKKYKIAVREFEELYNKYPDNNYYARILIKSYYKQGRYNEAFTAINEILNRWKERELPHFEVMEEELLTWKGRIFEKKDEREQAIEAYKEAFAASTELPNSTERSFYTAAGYLAGKLLYKQNNVNAAKSYLKKVSRAGIDNKYKDRSEDLLEQIGN